MNSTFMVEFHSPPLYSLAFSYICGLFPSESFFVVVWWVSQISIIQDDEKGCTIYSVGKPLVGDRVDYKLFVSYR